jgi:L-histidine N-alpha-methyltransferase
MISSASPLDTRGEGDVLAGLSAREKRLPCRLLYDARGAALFERICALPSYYLTRSELGLLGEHLGAIAAMVGSRARVLEPGSGAGHKTRMLLGALDRPAAYVPIDVSVEQLERNARALRKEFPGLEVAPVHGDYTRTLHVPRAGEHARTLLYFPGSTIGNFEPHEASAFLARFGELAGSGAMMLLGADSNADRESLRDAYDDPEGVTAEFNLNVLAHLNRTHDATFDLATFTHEIVWDAARARVEMHLVSSKRQRVSVGARTIAFDRGESIVTEHCYKHRPAVLERLIEGAGWRVRRVIPDADGRMRLWLAARA